MGQANKREISIVSTINPKTVNSAEVAELADARDSKSRPRKRVRVRLPPSAVFRIEYCVRSTALRTSMLYCVVRREISDFKSQISICCS